MMKPSQSPENQPIHDKSDSNEFDRLFSLYSSQESRLAADAVFLMDGAELSSAYQIETSDK